ncbi:MAG: M24 family metallopeptidase [Bacteroidales bacterium]|nr:M24 family metallopeptidase [Bacteroidales bacterium]
MSTTNNVTGKIRQLRSLMDEQKWDAVVISGTDPHNSEYLPERWQQRKLISGFTGSYGTVVITKTHAGLWTDTRYFIQAAQELEDTEFTIHPLRVPGAVDYPQWLASEMQEDVVIGIDGSCMPYQEVEKLKKALAPIKGKVKDKTDFLTPLWPDRPPLPMNPVFILEEKYSGKEAHRKIEELRKKVHDAGCTHIVLNALDQIAWLFNIRSHDIPFNPVVISYALIGMEEATLFITPGKIGEKVEQSLAKQGIVTSPYGSLTNALQELPQEARVMTDGNTLSYSIFNQLVIHPGKENIHDFPSPVILEKAIKNQVEINGFRKAFLSDGVAMERFLFWLEKELEAGSLLTEKSVSKKLSWIRALSEEAMGDSFQSISAYGSNAALPHYNHGAEEGSLLEKKGLYLIDSGGQYLSGTTDITRTVPLGPLSPLEREDYTIALKGMMALSTAVFLSGTKGTHLDMLAREPLWKYYRNYGHGTGHGVGHFLCVHEGPQDIRMTWRDQDILPGMLTSNEPGLYREGSHGVRHENILLCQVLKENEFGEWLGFETMTLCHIDTSPLLIELLEDWEIKWLNNYNSHVFNTLSPLLTYEESLWLTQKTAPLPVP